MKQQCLMMKLKRGMKGILAGVVCCCVAAGAMADEGEGEEESSEITEDFQYWLDGDHSLLNIEYWQIGTGWATGNPTTNVYPSAFSSAYLHSGSSTLSSGETFQVANFTVGRGWGGYATNTIAGGTLTVTNDTSVGWYSDGHGWFDLQSGTVTLNNLYVADSNSPDGHLIQSGGTMTVSGDAWMGVNSGSVAGWTMTGGEMNVSSTETWMGGSGGTAEWTMTGGTYTGNSLFFGRDGGSATWNMSGGTVNLLGTSYGTFLTGWGTSTSTINISGTAAVTMTGGTGATDAFMPRGGTCNTTVSGGSLTMDGGIYMGWDDNCGTGKLEVAGGTVSIGGAIYVGQGASNIASVEVTGGTLTATEIQVGRGSAATGAVTIGGGETQIGTLLLGENTASAAATLTITDGTLTTTNSVTVNCMTSEGGTSGIEMTGGTWNIEGTELFLGCNNDNEAVMNVSGGTITSHTIHVGRDGGTGTLNISGGKVTITDISGWIGPLNAGWNNSKGTINISGDADVDVTGNVYVPSSGTGELNISGGALTVDGTISICANNASTGTVTIAGGTLTTQNIYAGAAASDSNIPQVVFAGGTLSPIAASDNFINEYVTLKVTDLGAVIDTDYAVTVVPAFAAADNATAAGVVKGGEGTLTLSSAYALPKMTVRNGLVALSNGVAADVTALEVVFDPDTENLEPGTYTLVTGLGEFADASITKTLDSDIYTATWDYTSGTLSVTIAYDSSVIYTVDGNFNQAEAEIGDNYQAIVFTGANAKLTGACDLSGTSLDVIFAADGWLDLNGNDLTLSGYSGYLGAVITNSSETAATLTIGVNDGVMAGNATTAFGGNMRVVVTGNDTTGFNSSITNTLTGGIAFSNNNYRIACNVCNFGTGPIAFLGNGGFNPTVDQGNYTGTIAVSGTNNMIYSVDTGSWITYYFNDGTTWSGDGELNLYGTTLFELGNKPNAFANFTGTFKLTSRVLMWNGDRDMSKVIWELVAPYSWLSTSLDWRYGTDEITIGDLRTETEEYNENISLGHWGWENPTANWAVGALNRNSTFAGRIAYGSETHTDEGTGESTEYIFETNIRKIGTGAWTLNGPCEAPGTITVAEGRMNFLQSVSNATTVVVSSGATLGGSGTLNGPVTLNTGATIAASTTRHLKMPNADVSLTGVNLVVDDAASMAAPAVGGKTYTVLTAKSITGKVTLPSDLPTKTGGAYGAFVVDNSDGSESLVLKRKATGTVLIVK